MTDPLPPTADHFERFGIFPGVLRRLLDEAVDRGADDCDLFFEHNLTQTVALSDGAVNRVSLGVDLGLGIRVVVGDRVGFAFTEDLSLDAMLAAARTASQIAQGETAWARVDVTPERFADFYPARRPWTDVGTDERVRLVRSWEQASFARDPRITKVQAYLSDSHRVILIVRPDGRLVQDVQPMSVAWVSCSAEDGDRKESSTANLSSRTGWELFEDPSRSDLLVQRAVDRTLFLLHAGSPPAGEMPVVLGAGASGILLHEAIGHGMEADFNRKGTSTYAHRMGQRIASGQVTIVDDGTIPFQRGSINTDDEGNPTECTTLVEDGILRGFLHDEISARHFDVEPTGSGRRQSFRHVPIPRMRCTYMRAGPHAPEEIIASVRKGIYCESFGNGQVQIGAGDFAFYMRSGWLIEDGRLTRPIKDANIIGNGPQALERVTMVGSDLLLDEGGWTCGKEGQGVPVGQGMPTVLVSSLVVGGSGT